jgi:hypothetical protein
VASFTSTMADIQPDSVVPAADQSRPHDLEHVARELAARAPQVDLKCQGPHVTTE